MQGGQGEMADWLGDTRMNLGQEEKAPAQVRPRVCACVQGKGCRAYGRSALASKGPPAQVCVRARACVRVCVRVLWGVRVWTGARMRVRATDSAAAEGVCV